MKKKWVSTIMGAGFVTALVLSGNSMAKVQSAENAQKNLVPDPGTCELESLQGSGIGDVKFSVLSESDFQAVNGAEWVQLRGQSFASLSYGTYTAEKISNYMTNGSVYYSTGNIPDARGRFLRMENRGTTVNPQAGLKLGQPQEDEFKLHDHGMGGLSIPRFGGPATSWHPSAAAHTATTFQANGGSETRAKNVTVNIFVKIRRRCVDTSIQNQIDANAAAYDAIQCASESYPNGCMGMEEDEPAEKTAKAACFRTIVDEYETGATYGAVVKSLSLSCISQTVSHAKKLLLEIGADQTQAESDWYNYLVQQYPYYYVINTGVN